MLIKKQVVAFRSAILVLLFTTSLFSIAWAQAASHFRMERDAQGVFKPFKAVSVPLPDFLREYSRLTGIPMTASGIWDNELKGAVTLFLRHSLKPQEMKELVYRVLNDNSYAVIDAPAKNGWIIERIRDARDDALPIYEASEVPETNRLITAHYTTKYIDPESIARAMRSFMPTYSRILSTEGSQILITDTGSNIRKVFAVVSRMDTEAAEKNQREALITYAPGVPRACGEQRIEKLVVEKLEINDGNSAGGGSNNGPATQMKHIAEGAKK
jgi:type II secretory pathway component GspD/PulD (secretin)